MQSKKAFTIVELITVITILAILLIIITPIFTSVGKGSKISLRDSKIITLVTAAEEYGNDLINDFQNCIGSSTQSQLVENCVVSIPKLSQLGYVDAEDNDGNIIDPSNNEAFTGNLLLCYDFAHVNVYASYVDNGNYSCKDISINSDNTLSLSSVGGVGYIGGDSIEINIIKSGKFEGFRCDDGNTGFASCSVEDDKLVLKMATDRNIDFGGKNYKEIPITLYGDYKPSEGPMMSLSKVYSLKVYPTSLEIKDGGDVCMKVSSSGQTDIVSTNAGVMSVTSTDNDVLEGIAKNGRLFLSSKNKAGNATLTIKESNGNNTASLTKQVYNLELDESFPDSMVINHYRDVEIDQRGTGGVRIYTDNPNVIQFSSTSSSQSGDITLQNDDTSFRIVAIGTGVAKVFIEGSTCGREVREITVSSLSFKDETKGFVYVGGARRSVEIEVEEAHNLECTSSDPAAATCEVHATTVEIIPGSVPSDNVILTVGSPQVGYAYYKLQVLKTTIGLYDSSGNTVSNVCRKKSETRNDSQVYVRGVNLGETTIEVDDWYLAEADVAASGLERPINIYPRIGEQIDPPYILGVNTGRTPVDVKEGNGNQVARFYYNIYTMKVSANSVKLKTDEVFEIEVESSGTGELSVSSGNNDVASAEILGSRNYNWNPNSVNKYTIRITANGTGSTTITVRGASCALEKISVSVQGKSLSLKLVPGTYTTRLESDTISCETKGILRTCQVEFPRIYTSSLYQVVGYSKTKDSKEAMYKPGDKITLSAFNTGSTYYGNSLDVTPPVCSIENPNENTIVGETTYLTLNCKDPGSGIDDGSKLTMEDLFLSDGEVGEIVEFGNATSIENGVSYRIGVRSKKTGLYTLSIKAGKILDKAGNANEAVDLHTFFAAEYEFVDRWFVGKNNVKDVIAVLYDNSNFSGAPSGMYSLYFYGRGDMIDFNSASYTNQAPWYENYRARISNVYVGNDITNVGSKAFYNASGLIEVSGLNGVVNINSYAFANANIRSLNISNSTKTIGERAFYGNKNLSLLILGNKVSSIADYAFYNHSLINVNIPSSVTTIGEGAFGVDAERSCLETLEFSAGSLLKSIGSRSFIYHKLRNLSIPDSVTSIGDAAFEQIDVVEATLENVEFGFNSRLQSIGNEAFLYAKLGSLELPESLSSIGANAFGALRDGVSLLRIGQNVRNIGNNFAYGENLQEFVVDEANPYFTAIDGVLYNKNLTTLIKCPDDYYKQHSVLNVPSTVKVLQAGAFEGWLDFENNVNGFDLNLPSGLTNMNIDDNFISFTIGRINIEGNSFFDSVDGVLYDKAHETAYRIPTHFRNREYTILDGTRTIADYFGYGNSKVETINVPDTVASIGNHAFHTDSHYSFEVINLLMSDSLNFGDTAFEIMVYPQNASINTRSRTVNVTSSWVKERIESVYRDKPYSFVVNKT